MGLGGIRRRSVHHGNGVYGNLVGGRNIFAAHRVGFDGDRAETLAAAVDEN